MRISDWSSDVCSSDLLSLPLRHHPVLDPYVLTCEWVGPTCDIADGINARSTGPKKCIHSNTAFDDEAGLLRKRQCWSNADADDHKICVDLFAACENDTLLVNGAGSRVKVECDADRKST